MGGVCGKAYPHGIMKTIKIKFMGFYKTFTNFESLEIYKILSKHYDVKICEDADYIICSCFGEPYEFCKYPQVRIMLTEENFIPDFNLVDYGICPYPISFMDRCFYYPTFIGPVCKPECDNAKKLENKPRYYDSDFLHNKQYFANFISGHESEHNIRGDFFKKLCEYKRVESAGIYLNNMPNNERVKLGDDSKIEFQRKCKFSLCFESTKHEGFITEKITEAFYADTIPVYYGSDSVTEIFNPKAFINCNDFETMEEAIEYIKKVDNDDDLYLEMMNQPIFRNKEFVGQVLEKYELFLKNIFDQPIEKAYRRSQVYSPKRYEDYIINVKRGTAFPIKHDFKVVIIRVLNKLPFVSIKL